MAEMIIALRRDPATGKQNVLVKLESDPDSLPIEHEQMHRKLVEKLIGSGLNPDELGEIVIDRDGTILTETMPVGETPANPTPQSQGN